MQPMGNLETAMLDRWRASKPRNPVQRQKATGGKLGRAKERTCFTSFTVYHRTGDIRMGKYDNWKLSDLKDELRRRQVKVSGRKKELIERCASNNMLVFRPNKDGVYWS